MSSAEEDCFADLDFCTKLTALVASGVTGRGVSCLCKPEVWQDALRLIGGKRKIAVVSGFYVPAALAPETDGPAGSLVLARALRSLGHEAEIWTDSLCLESMRCCARVLNFPEHFVLDVSGKKSGDFNADLLIYLERLGRAQDGAYYNMRGEDISLWTEALDSFALSGIAPVIGIGDGGNEVGMGSFLAPLSGIMPAYSSCLCVVPSDVCIAVDVSNWGGYALAAALSRSCGRWLGQTGGEELAMLEALCACGVVDGVSRECRLSVDGLGIEEHLKIRDELQALSETEVQSNRNVRACCG